MITPFFSGKESVFFATFALHEHGKRLQTNGMIEPMLSYLLPRVRKFLLMDQPHPGSDVINPIIEEYGYGSLSKRYSISRFIYLPIYLICWFNNTSKTQMSFKLRDLCSVLWVGITNNCNYDLFIGLEEVNAFAGILLKKLGRVKSVIYYVSDYSPKRFGSGIVHAVYIWLDRFCVEHADATWDVSLAMVEGRQLAGLPKNKKYPIVHVPNGLFPSQIAPLPFSKRKPFTLVYMGTVEKEMGPDLAIRAMIKVRKKVPQATLHIIGGSGDRLARLKQLAHELRLDRAVIFYGFVPDNDEMAKIIRHCAVGVAPYRSTAPFSLRWYGDASKIRMYAANGLPVVTTRVPPLGRFIEQEGAGIIVKDTEQDFANGMITLLTKKTLYKKLANRAKTLFSQYEWEKVYNRAFADTQKIIDSLLTKNAYEV